MPRSKGHGNYHARAEYRRSNERGDTIKEMQVRLQRKGHRAAAEELDEAYLEEFHRGRELFDKAYLSR